MGRFLFLGVVLAFAGCELDPGAISEDRQEIIGGGAAARGQFPTSVAILYRNEERDEAGLCSGTLISPTAVLTAAHCVSPADFSQRFGRAVSQQEITANTRVFFDTPDIDDPGQGFVVQAAGTTPHPLFDPAAPGAHDVGVVTLSTRITDRTPTPIDTRSGADLVGALVTAVGYGIHDFNDPSTFGEQFFVEKRVGDCELLLGLSDATSLCFDQFDNAGLCLGDSGGGSFANVDGVETLLGVTSLIFFNGDTCAQSLGHQVRVSGELEFLAPFLVEEVCVEDGVCEDNCGRGGNPADPDCNNGNEGGNAGGGCTAGGAPRASGGLSLLGLFLLGLARRRRR
jgi:MYXO-CTERM domain-containing protein